MTFKERFTICGILTTQSSLHIGCGQTIAHPELQYRDGSSHRRDVDISAVVTDHRCKPYIPGSSLKGRLRSILRHQVDQVMLDFLFGTEQQKDDRSRAGCLEFGDSMYVDGPPTHASLNVPYWHNERGTGILSAVAIDRKTRTAADEKLLHREFVPPLSTFSVEITGNGLNEESIAVLLHGLDQLRVPGFGLGADSGDGQGCLSWQLKLIRRLRKADLETWKLQPLPPIGTAAGSLLDAAELQAIQKRSVAYGATKNCDGPAVRLTIKLHFSGPFLVNDQYQTQARTTNQGDPSFAPLRDINGETLLPARSIRGALRSQAERILRTLSTTAIPHKAGALSCDAIYAICDLGKLCLACQLFGTAGWRAPLWLSDFTPDPMNGGAAGIPLEQEFLAIDRFTGGGADGLKFHGKFAYKPILTGTLNLAMKEPWMLGFLCLLLRDLAEGDISLGFGASKGYGACRAEFDWAQLGGTDERKAWVRAFREKCPKPFNIPVARNAEEEIRHAVP